jgi:DNA-binding Lrp family transcriptional regulator
LRPAPWLQAYVIVTLKSHSSDAAGSFCERLPNLDEVVECQKIAEASDMIVKVSTRDLETINQILTQEWLGSPEVASAQSSNVLA